VTCAARRRQLLTGLGTQAALVALPFQLYIQTRSAFLTGLLGAVVIVLALVTSGPRLGDVEAGSVAGLTSARSAWCPAGWRAWPAWR
jgi:hypothetical protein